MQRQGAAASCDVGSGRQGRKQRNRGFDPARRQRLAALDDFTHSSLMMAKTRDVAESFEAALSEARCDRREDGGRPAAVAGIAAAYRRGAELLQYCQAALKDAQLQIEVLEKGVLKAFAEADTGGGGSDES
jgi:exodeoxyribonuclease VII small subunit